MKPSQQLLEAAWIYVLLHNKEFPNSPLFIDDSGNGPIITSKPQCIVSDGMIAHRGHGPGSPCKKYLTRKLRRAIQSPARGEHERPEACKANG